MANINISEVHLLNVPLENDYKNTLYFTSKENQTEFFKSKKVHSFTDFSYQRKDNIIRVPKHIDDLWNCNYVMYQNKKYSDKWFYAFIIDMEYVNDGTTQIKIDTDVIQTWLFDYNLKESFVEREHVSNDTIGLHTLEEGLETGDYKCDLHEIDQTLGQSKLVYVIGSTSEPLAGDAKDTPAGSGVYNGIYSGVKYYQYESTSAIDIILELFANHAKTDCITGIFLAPEFLTPLKSGAFQREVAESATANTYEKQIDKNLTSMDGYTPRNKKLFCYPYNYLVVSNNNGGNAIYKYERFSTSDCKFSVKGALTPGCSIRMTPKDYNGAVENDDESINLGKYPICNFTCDMYTNWLTQNSVNIAGHTVTSDQMNMVTSGVSSALQVAGGVALLASGAGALAGAGMIANGLMGGSSGIGNALMQQKQHEMIPPQTRGNLNCGDVITSSNKNTFHFYKMCCKKEYLEILDKYFDMFGYKVNMVKVPNKAHRTRYWYTKTMDVNIDGAIPNNDMNKIKACYNNGITFWRNANEIQNYSLSNNTM